MSTAEVETELRPREALAYPHGTCYRECIPAERAARTFGASCRHVRVQVGADLIQERSDHSILLADDEASEGLNHPWKWRRGACAADRRCVQVARQRPWAGEGTAATLLGYERRRAGDASSKPPAPCACCRRKWHYRLIRNFSSQITQVRGSRFAVKFRNLLSYFRY